MTKEQLKAIYNAPKKDDFLSYEDYISAKMIWIENHPMEYAEILAAPNENQQDFKNNELLRRFK